MARASFLGGGVVIAATIILGRTTGAAAHGLEESGILQQLPDLIPSGQCSALLRGGGATTASEAKQPSVFAIESQNVGADAHDPDIVLPTDSTKRPKEIVLGNYNPITNEGTVWSRVVEYADTLGYDHLTEQQKYAIVDSTLDDRGISWNEARDLPSNHSLSFLTPDRMEKLLEDRGARRTHAPDFPPVNTGETPSSGEPVVPVSPATTPPREHDVNGHDDSGWAFGQREVSPNVLLGTSLVALGAVGVYAARQRSKRLDAEEALHRLHHTTNDADTHVTSATTIPPPIAGDPSPPPVMVSPPIAESKEEAARLWHRPTSKSTDTRSTRRRLLDKFKKRKGEKKGSKLTQ